MWYFSHLGHDLSHPISKSVVRGLFHHSGSLALGSLILTFVAIVRFLLDLVHVSWQIKYDRKHLNNQHLRNTVQWKDVRNVSLHTVIVASDTLKNSFDF